MWSISIPQSHSGRAEPFMHSTRKRFVLSIVEAYFLFETDTVVLDIIEFLRKKLLRRFGSGDLLWHIQKHSLTCLDDLYDWTAAS